MKFRPCIDLHNGKVKQIIGGSLDTRSDGLIENFVSDKDAAFYGQLYKADGLTGGHTIMLGPGNEQEVLKALQAYPGGLQVGGGITSENASKYLDAGASHVIVTSYVFKDGQIYQDNLERIVSEVGIPNLVLDLSCRQKGDSYFVVTDRWQKFTSWEINASNLASLAQYCSEFLIHAVDVEGKCSGVQEDLITKLGEWSTIPTTYAGGVSSFADLGLVKRLGAGKLDVTIGSALDIFGGSLPYKEVVRLYGRGETTEWQSLIRSRRQH